MRVDTSPCAALNMMHRTAKVVLHLRNVGSDAFEHAKYGDKISE